MEPPKRIGDLVVDGLLGEGGMGRVYLCTDEALGRHIAVKVLQPSLLADSTMRERFVREARALAKVKSPHVVTIHAIGEDAVVGPYVVMERLIGEDLLARLHARGALPIDEVLLFAGAAAQGLAHAHEAGVVHRDIKPANLFCKREGDHEHLVITDFGLAKDFSARPAPGSGATFVPASQLTQANVIVGTPAYLAPELARGQAASPSSDLYALGATLFHLVVGEPPFVGDSTIEVITKAVLELAPRASSRVVGLPVEFDGLLAELLEKHPDNRPSSAHSVLVRLTAMQPGYAQMTPSRPFSNPALGLGLMSSPSSSVVPTLGSTQVMGSLSDSLSSSSLATALKPSPTDDTLPSFKRGPLNAALRRVDVAEDFFAASKRTVRTILSAEGNRGPWATQPRLWAAVTIVGALVLALGLGSLVGEDRRDRIEGDAAGVQAEIEAIDNKKASDLVDLGLAHWTQGRRKQAFATWRQAVHAGAVDEVMLRSAFAAIEQKADNGAEELLTEWKTTIEPGLREALTGNWWPRHHALAVLEARKTATDNDRHDVAFKDIDEGDCASRRYGLLSLKRFGRGTMAMQAIKGLQQNLPNNICLFSELRSSEDAVRRRTNNQP